MQAVGGGENGLLGLRLVEVEGADLSLHGPSGLVDDQLEQGIWLDGRGRRLAQPLQKEQLTERSLFGWMGHTNLRHEPKSIHEPVPNLVRFTLILRNEL